MCRGQSGYAVTATGLGPGRPRLRDRQAWLAREAILEALRERLEREEPEAISMGDLADSAGVSRRTLYRYFPSRDELFAAAGEWIYGRLGITTEISGGADAIAPSFDDASRRFEKHPRLVRALLRSTVGRAVRSPLREQRVRAIETALAEVTEGLSPRDAAHAAALIAHLCSSATWVALQDDEGLSARGSRAAIRWAIQTLVGDLRRSQAHNDQRKAT
jgi:AcrR family transcriptional regulator